MTILIKPVNLNHDVAAIAELTTQIGYPTQTEVMKERLMRLQAQERYTTLVFIDHGQVVAYIGFVEEISCECADPYFRILVLIVDQAHRDKGIGQKLLAHVEHIASQQGIQKIVVSSGNRAERLPAHQFYLNHGFKAYSTTFVKILTPQDRPLS